MTALGLGSLQSAPGLQTLDLDLSGSEPEDPSRCCKQVLTPHTEVDVFLKGIIGGRVAGWHSEWVWKPKAPEGKKGRGLNGFL